MIITAADKIEHLKRWREIYPRLRKNAYTQTLMRDVFGEGANEIACCNAMIADYESAISAVVDADRPNPPWPRI